MIKSACLLTLLMSGLVASFVYGEDWPSFRGPTGQGVSSERSVPRRWSATSNVVWKAKIPGEGWSSPIVCAGRVFVTTATQHGVSCHVLALDCKTGQTLWDKEVFRQVLKKKREQNSYATPTPVTDGQRVYAVFADGSFAALALDGSVAWTNRDWPFYGEHGLGSSPVLFEDLLIMARDGSSEGEDKELGWQKPWDQSYLLALDKKTGKLRWKASRGLSRIAHATPIILADRGKAQLISCAGDVVQCFDPKTGDRLWSVSSKGEGVVPSPVAGTGLVFTSSGFGDGTIRAIRTGGRGDVTRTHIAWEQTQGVPLVSSFLYVQPYLYTMTMNGIAFCFDAQTGKVTWRERIGGNHWASPIYADGHIYFLSQEGEATVIEAKPQFHLVARNPLHERTQASPAVCGHNVFIRTERNLYCIGKSTNAPAG